MFLHVNSVRYLRDYELQLEFSNGTVKIVNLENELYGEVFEPLRDLALFRAVAVNPESGTIEWPNGADLAPEFLFEIGRDVEHVV
jgi:hypothetical protein